MAWRAVAQRLDLWAEGIAMGPQGLVLHPGGQAWPPRGCADDAAGAAQRAQYPGASCAAIALGLSLDDLARAIRDLPPVPHRLQLIDSGSGVTVIDDSYNANPIGAMEALEVLRSFTAGQRILVTPGMVELGALEAQLNEELGAKAAEVCDYVVLVGVGADKAVGGRTGAPELSTRENQGGARSAGRHACPTHHRGQLETRCSSKMTCRISIPEGSKLAKPKPSHWAMSVA